MAFQAFSRGIRTVRQQAGRQAGRQTWGWGEEDGGGRRGKESVVWRPFPFPSPSPPLPRRGTKKKKKPLTHLHRNPPAPSWPLLGFPTSSSGQPHAAARAGTTGLARGKRDGRRRRHPPPTPTPTIASSFRSRPGEEARGPAGLLGRILLRPILLHRHLRRRPSVPRGRLRLRLRCSQPRSRRCCRRCCRRRCRRHLRSTGTRSPPQRTRPTGPRRRRRPRGPYRGRISLSLSLFPHDTRFRNGVCGGGGICVWAPGGEGWEQCCLCGVVGGGVAAELRLVSVCGRAEERRGEERGGKGRWVIGDWGLGIGGGEARIPRRAAPRRANRRASPLALSGSAAPPHSLNRRQPRVCQAWSG